MSDKTDMSANSHPYQGLWKFILPSLAGILLFMLPVPYHGTVTIPVAILAKSFNALLGDQAVKLVTVLVAMSALLSLLTTLIKSLRNIRVLNSLFATSLPWMIVRLLGGILALMTLTKVGPEVIWQASTGGLVLHDLLPVLLSVFIFAGLLLPLLLNFGLLELIGSLMTKIMRPVFNLPGRSAIDCSTSWLGDGTVGVMLTTQQYEQKSYTQREAAVIATTFSAVSISFALVVIAEVGLEHLFLPFYLAVSLAGFVAALVVPRLPPLSWKKDIYLNGIKQEPRPHQQPSLRELFHKGLNEAIARANTNAKLRYIARGSCKNAADMVFGVLPIVMAIGTLALVVAENTPIFSLMGTPFIPLLELLAVPDAVKASETIMVGFADMFIPSIMIASVESEMTRFIISALSITQLIYMSEVGALILGSRIPVNLLELFMIFILRTLVTLPIIAGVAHLLF